jgi:hypothetical protein
MAPVKTTVTATAADLDVIQNRVAVALARRERLIKSWTASSARPRPPPKTQEELDAEDADLFNPTPAGLGLGAPIPKEFLDGDVKRKEISSNDKLRHLLLGNRAGLQASKPRDGKEKAVGSKRVLGEESSDEDQGRSALGKAKKSKNESAQITTDIPLKDLATVEPQKGIKSTFQESIIQKPNHVSRPEVKPYVKSDKRTEISQGNNSFQNAKIQVTGKKPLVDYGSDDESDYPGSGLASETSQKKQSSKSNFSPVPSSSTKVAIDIRQNIADHNRSDTTIKSKSATPPIADTIFNKQDVADPVKNLPNGGIVRPKNSSSKSGSSYSSKSRASTTESEPSDMETAIPLSLTSDVIGRTSIPATNNILSPIEVKRAKKRERRARKKEKDQQRKALVLGITSGGAEKSIIASVTGVEKLAIPSADGTGVATKIRDRLRDANGN